MNRKVFHNITGLTLCFILLVILAYGSTMFLAEHVVRIVVLVCIIPVAHLSFFCSNKIWHCSK